MKFAGAASVVAESGVANVLAVQSDLQRQRPLGDHDRGVGYLRAARRRSYLGVAGENGLARGE